MSQQRVALVTGGNRGIGLAIVELLAGSGLRVMLASRNVIDGQKAAADFRSKGLQVEAVALDMASTPAIAALGSDFGAQKIGIDVLVNNAGLLHHKTLLDLTDDEISESFAVNFHGPLLLCRALVPGMVERGYGRIVNISSEWGSFASGLGGPGVYGITKAALNAITIRLARDLPACVKANSMDPGWVKTRMGGEGAPRTPETAADTALWLATLPDTGPTGRFFRDRQEIPW